eukprot:3012729-Rhodomonas_salina.2
MEKSQGGRRREKEERAGRKGEREEENKEGRNAFTKTRVLAQKEAEKSANCGLRGSRAPQEHPPAAAPAPAMREIQPQRQRSCFRHCVTTGVPCSASSPPSSASLLFSRTSCFRLLSCCTGRANTEPQVASLPPKTLNLENPKPETRSCLHDVLETCFVDTLDHCNAIAADHDHADLVLLSRAHVLLRVVQHHIHELVEPPQHARHAPICVQLHCRPGARRGRTKEEDKFHVTEEQEGENNTIVKKQKSQHQKITKAPHPQHSSSRGRQKQDPALRN